MFRFSFGRTIFLLLRRIVAVLKSASLGSMMQRGWFGGAACRCGAGSLGLAGSSWQVPAFAAKCRQKENCPLVALGKSASLF